MKKLVLVIIATVMVFGSCVKTPLLQCEIDNFGYLVIENESSKTITIKINKKTYGSIPKLEKGSFELTKGEYQVFGVVDGDTAYQFVVNIRTCEYTHKTLIE